MGQLQWTCCKRNIHFCPESQVRSDTQEQRAMIPDDDPEEDDDNDEQEEDVEEEPEEEPIGVYADLSVRQ